MKKQLLLAFVLLSALTQAGTTVREAFQTETSDAKPWCYWYWMHGCVSKAGIDADLQAMQEAGLGGAFIFAIRGTEKPSKYEPAVETLSPEWFQLVKYTVQEAGKRNLQLAMHISDGFALAGGPWIKPEQSMQKLVWSSVMLKGGKMLNYSLPQPEMKQNYYEDVAVFAYKASEKTPKPVRISVEGDTSDLSYLADESKSGTFRSETPTSILYTYKKPFVCRSVVTKVNGTVYQCHRFKLEASMDGVHFQYVAQLEAPRHGWQNTAANVTHAIPPTKARFLRFSWTKEGSAPGAEDNDNAKWKPTLKLNGIYPSAEAKVDQFEGKNGSVWRVSANTTEQQLPIIECLPKEACIDVSAFVNKKGRLNWKAPKGRWTILRIGHTSTGTTNATAGAGAGLECDKFSREAVQQQFDGWYGRICDSIGQENVGKVLTLLHIDSWECGSQNWSLRFTQEFLKRRGYDLKPYLPILAGVPMVSAAFSEQVLRDVRETQNDLLQDNFFKVFVENAHAKGLKVSAESVAPTMMSDGMGHFKTVDYPMGEFWLQSPTHDKPNDMLDAISGAHINGKNLIWAEGFTQLKNTWIEAPSNLKGLLDLQFANGLNKMVFHVFVHNPFTDRKPGMTLDGMGLMFQRDQTWWKPAKAWMDYIQRCQRLLQLGHPVADLAVFGGLELPSRALLPDRLVPSLPGLFGAERVEQERVRLANAGVPMTESPVGVSHTATITTAQDWVNPLRGYTYDTFDPEVLFQLKPSGNGRFSTPEGASYSALVVPMPHPMAPDSVTVYGHYEQKLREVIARLRQNQVPVLMPSQVADDLSAKALLPWKADDLSALGIPRDLEIHEAGREAFNKVAFAHRSDANMDLYFLSNQSDTVRNLDLSFRMHGRIPEVFDPVDGQMRQVDTWATEHARTHFKLKLEAFQSLFVVFEQPTTSTGKSAPFVPERNVEAAGLNGPWSVQFDTAFGGSSQPVVFPELSSWSLRPEVRFYSGTALYRGGFALSNVEKNNRYRLQLGKVAELAEVFVNGVSCGTAWTAPFSVDVSNALQKGENRLEIRVTNTWANRLEGDALLPEAQRLTWTDGKYRKKTRDLLDAGLLGPLKLTVTGEPEPIKMLTTKTKQ